MLFYNTCLQQDILVYPFDFPEVQLYFCHLSLISKDFISFKYYSNILSFPIFKQFLILGNLKHHLFINKKAVAVNCQY